MPHEPEEVAPAVMPPKAVLRPVDVVNNLIDAVAAAGTEERLSKRCGMHVRRSRQAGTRKTTDLCLRRGA